MSAIADPVPGIDAGPVTAWFADRVPEAVPPLSFTLVAGGRSNLTFRVDDAAGHTWALRRPPVSHVLPTAHDMAREHRILSALGPTPVPVPRTHGLCEDASVNGAPFYVMEFVDGLVVRNAAVAEASLDEAARGRAGDSLADTLAALHAVDVDAVGLGDLGRREGYIERQLRRWSGQVAQSVGNGPRPDGLVVLEEVGTELASRVPEQRESTIVHGDFRLGNLLRDGPRVTAVVDWEIWSVGDPRVDLGWFLTNADPATYRRATRYATSFPSPDELAEEHAGVLGRALPDLEWFRALACFKSTATWSLIVKHNRRRPEPDPEIEAMAGALPHLLERATELLS